MHLQNGVGGANSKYSKSCGNNSWCGSEQLIPLDFTTAKKWAEEKLSGDEYEEIFGEVTDNENRKTIGVCIATSTHEKLKRMSSENGFSVSEIIENLILGIDIN